MRAFACLVVGVYCFICWFWICVNSVDYFELYFMLYLCLLGLILVVYL